MTKEKKLRYSSIDGTRLAGVLLMPSAAPRAVILLHGINVDKDEWGGFHKHLAEELFLKRIASLRFDFRGHGQSDGDFRDVSLLGEILDVRASVRVMQRHYHGPISFIATSFAAGPAIFAAAELPNVSHLVLIAPVLDYAGTFLEPRTEWAQSAFNERSIKQMERTGYVVLDGRRLSASLIEEMRWLRPWQVLSKLELPVLLIHGDRDSMVPYRLSRKRFKPTSASKMITIHGADHGYVDEDDDEGTSARSLENRALVVNAVYEFLQPEPVG